VALSGLAATPATRPGQLRAERGPSNRRPDPPGSSDVAPNRGTRRCQSRSQSRTTARERRSAMRRPPSATDPGGIRASDSGRNILRAGSHASQPHQAVTAAAPAAAAFAARAPAALTPQALQRRAPAAAQLYGASRAWRTRSRPRRLGRISAQTRPISRPLPDTANRHRRLLTPAGTRGPATRERTQRRARFSPVHGMGQGLRRTVSEISSDDDLVVALPEHGETDATATASPTRSFLRALGQTLVRLRNADDPRHLLLRR